MIFQIQTPLEHIPRDRNWKRVDLGSLRRTFIDLWLFHQQIAHLGRHCIIYLALPQGDGERDRQALQIAHNHRAHLRTDIMRTSRSLAILITLGIIATLFTTTSARSSQIMSSIRVITNNV